MSAKSLERSIYVLALVVAAVPFAMPYFGFHGFQEISVRLSLSFFILALICAGFVSQEKRKIDAVSDDSARRIRERALAKKVGFIGIALIVALPCGYLIGRQF
jgi:hypothetical protein